MQLFAVVSIYNVKSPDLTNETFYKDKEKKRRMQIWTEWGEFRVKSEELRMKTR